MRNEKTRMMIVNAILLGIGLILHAIFPMFGLPITPDPTLAMLFIILIINQEDYASCLIAGIVTGIFTAMTTKFPGGQVPNLLDKIVTVNVMFVFMKAMLNMPGLKAMVKAKRDTIVAGLMFPIGTLISGTVFIYSAKIIVGLPGGAGFFAFFMAAVIPAVAVNLIFGLFLYKIVISSITKAGIKGISY